MTLTPTKIALSALPPTCPTPPLPAPPYPGLITLGPTRSERDALYNCCNTHSTTIIVSVNGTACGQSAECRVQECSVRDPVVACVALIREMWKIEGAFGCVVGMGKEVEVQVGVESGGGRMGVGKGRGWGVLLVVGFVAAVGGLGV